MNTRIVNTLSLLILLSVSLIPWAVADLIPETSMNLKNLVHGLKGLSVILAAWFLNQFIQKIVFCYIEKISQHRFTRLARHGITLILYMLAISFIVVGIWGQSILSLATFSGLVGAGIAVSIQSLVVDFFSGLFLDIERSYDVDDWLKLGDGQLVRVVKVGWRTTTFVNHENIQVVIPNHLLAHEKIENLSKPDPVIWEEIQITIDHEIPLDRAARLLKAAVSTVTDVHNKLSKVCALKLTEGGVIYLVKYAIHGVEGRLKARHAVLEAMTRSLHAYNLKVSETLGEYGLARGGQVLTENRSLDLGMILKKSQALQNLSEDEMNKLLKESTLSHYKEGEDLKGLMEDLEHTYIVAEGGVALNLLEADGEKHVSYLILGDLLGCFTTVALEEYPHVSLKAHTDVIMVVLSHKALKPLLKKHPEITEIVKDHLVEIQKTLKMIEKEDYEEQTLHSQLKERLLEKIKMLL